MSETDNTSQPESDPSLILGREMVEGIGSIMSDAFLRSGLPLDTKYAEIEFLTNTVGKNDIQKLKVTGPFPGTEYFLEYGVMLNEGQGMGHLHSRVKPDGTKLETSLYNMLGFKSSQEASEHIIRHLPDFLGSQASITIEVPRSR